MNNITNIIDLFEKHIGTNTPEVTFRSVNGVSFTDVPFKIAEEDGVYTYIYIPVLTKDYHYRGLVDAIVGLKYDLGETLAIMLNYMDSPKTVRYKKAYEELQDWRRTAKEFAKSHFGIA